jgi:hypothetical protein
VKNIILFLTAMFLVAKTWNNLNIPQQDKMCYTYPVEYYAAIKTSMNQWTNYSTSINVTVLVRNLQWNITSGIHIVVYYIMQTPAMTLKPAMLREQIRTDTCKFLDVLESSVPLIHFTQLYIYNCKRRLLNWLTWPEAELSNRLSSGWGN